MTVDAAPGTGFVTGPADQQLQDRAAGASAAAPYEVVVVAASTADGTPPDGQVYGGNVAAAVAAVRTALPEAEIVLLGPAGTEPGGLELQRDLLSAVAARFGAYFVDPVGRQWLVGKPALVAGDVPNDAGYAEMARRLAADLAVTFPATLLPSA